MPRIGCFRPGTGTQHQAYVEGPSPGETRLSSMCASKSHWRQLHQHPAANGVKTRVEDQRMPLWFGPRGVHHVTLSVLCWLGPVIGFTMQDGLLTGVLVRGSISAKHLHYRGRTYLWWRALHLPLLAPIWVRNVTSVMWSHCKFFLFFQYLNLCFLLNWYHGEHSTPQRDGHQLPVVYYQDLEVGGKEIKQQRSNKGWSLKRPGHVSLRTSSFIYQKGIAHLPRTRWYSKSFRFLTKPI